MWSASSTDNEFRQDQLAMAKFYRPKSRVWDKVPDRSTAVFESTRISYNTAWDRWKEERKPPYEKPARFVQSFRYVADCEGYRVVAGRAWRSKDVSGGREATYRGFLAGRRAGKRAV